MTRRRPHTTKKNPAAQSGRRFGAAGANQVQNGEGTRRAWAGQGTTGRLQAGYGPCTAANTLTYPLGSSFHGDEGVAGGGEVGNAESHHRQQHHAHRDARARAHRLQRRRGAGVDAVDVHRARSGPRAAARRWAHRHCRLIYPQAHRWQCTSLRNTSSGRRVAVLAHP